MNNKEMRVQGKKRSFSSRKALSSVVTAVLLIAIALIVVTLFSSWISNLTQEEGTTITNKTSTVSACSNSGINIDEVYLETSTNTSRAVVRNTGRATEVIVSAVILSKTGVNGTLNTSLPLSIASGDIKILVFNVTGAIPNCGNFSQVRVATECTSDFFREAPRNC